MIYTPQDNNKRIYVICAITSLFFIIIGFLIIICDKFKLLSKDMNQFLSNGGVVFSVVFIFVGAILLATSIYYYDAYKKLGKLEKELEGMENKIVWLYSDEDILNKIQNIKKTYMSKLFLMLGIFAIGIISECIFNNLSIMVSLRSFAIILSVGCLIYFIVLKVRVRAINKSPKQVIFTDELIVFEDQTILIKNVFSSLYKVEYDSSSNNLIFRCSYPKKYGNGSEAIYIYVPLEKRNEVQNVLDMYNK